MKQKIVSFLEYFVAAWIVFEYHTVYTGVLVNRNILLTGAFAMFFLILLSLKQLKGSAMPLVIYFIFMSFSVVVQTHILIYASLYLILVTEFFIYFRYCRHTEGNLTLVHKYARVMTFVGGTSVILWFLITVLGVVNWTGTFPWPWGSGNSLSIRLIDSFYNIYFNPQGGEFFGLEFTRNTAFFNEGPVYNICLCAALGIEVFLTEPRSKFRITVLVISIITTFTTTGQIFLCILFVVYNYFYVKRRSRLAKILMILSPVILIGVFYILSYIMEEKSHTGSYEARNISAMTMFETGMKSPIFGVGMYSDRKISDAGVSNSLFHLFAWNGFIGVFAYLYLLLWVPFRYWIKNHDRSWILFALLFFMCFTVTVSYYKVLDIFLLGFGLSFAGTNLKLDKANPNPPKQRKRGSAYAKLARSR